MAIEVLVDLPCAVKEVFPAEELARRVRAKARAEEALANARAHGDDRSPEAIRVRFVRADGDGGERVEERSLADVLKEGEGLDALAEACERCPARLKKQAFGCIETIGYPIARATEEFLIDRLPPMLSTLGGTFLVRAVREMKFDGAPVARMRAEGRIFFESDRPLHARWAEDEASWEVSSDQILHLLLFAGPITPRHALLIALVLGILPHAVAPEDVRELLADRRALADMLEPIWVPPSLKETQIGDVARLLEAVRKSLSLDGTVKVDA
jgi:hypothetical protein